MENRLFDSCGRGSCHGSVYNGEPCISCHKQ